MPADSDICERTAPPPRLRRRALIVRHTLSNSMADDADSAAPELCRNTDEADAATDVLSAVTPELRACDTTDGRRVWHAPAASPTSTASINLRPGVIASHPLSAKRHIRQRHRNTDTPLRRIHDGREPKPSDNGGKVHRQAHAKQGAAHPYACLPAVRQNQGRLHKRLLWSKHYAPDNALRFQTRLCRHRPGRQAPRDNDSLCT